MKTLKTLKELRKLSSSDLLTEVMRAYAYGNVFYENLEDSSKFQIVPHDKWGVAIVEKGEDGLEYQHPFNGDGSCPLTNRDYTVLVNLGLIETPNAFSWC